MATLQVTGKFGKVSISKDSAWLFFSIAEPDIKTAQGYTTPWFNLMVKADSPTGKLIYNNKDRLGVVTVNAIARQYNNPDKTTSIKTFVPDNNGITIITWKKTEAQKQRELLNRTVTPVSSPSSQNTQQVQNTPFDPYITPATGSSQNTTCENTPTVQPTQTQSPAIDDLEYLKHNVYYSDPAYQQFN